MARTPGIDHSIWEAALVGLEAQRTKINEQIAVVRAQLGTPKPHQKSAPPVGVPELRKKRVLSAAARKRIAIAQKKRWAAVRKVKQTKA